MSTKSDDQEQKPLGLFNIIQSVFAAAFGVQSNRRREEDFARGKPGHFIVAGLIFTVGFILILAAIVSLVIPG
ncbi:DUF2970 domain-containing protein [Endozoicomonadaceae bacterium StTr2]